MTGLIKQKQYDWKDSNLALFGSDLERQVKKESAQGEKAWAKAGQKVGVQIWRIVKFQVTDWPKEDYGKFYNGDSYIVLNTYTEDGADQLLFDVHFWIGKYSTQDEYGTAAYKTVELDTFLDDVPVQHREVQGHESALFKSYFKAITILEGGADSGFRTVKPEAYKPRLFHFHGDRKHVEVKQIPRCRSRLDSTDVYILDLGLTIYQWNGNGANVTEKTKAMQYVQTLAEERSGKAINKEVLDEHSMDQTPWKIRHEFYGLLNEDDEEDTDSQYEAGDCTTELYRLSDATGSMSFTKEKSGNVSQGDFDSKDVFILDTKAELFVWIGRNTTTAEKKNAMTYAHTYLMRSDHPLIPVSCFKEDKPTKGFRSAIAA
ncbi:gelsolin-like protein 2 isoform X1 [Haliotis rubra]|uniref:gelsolin-like protein 2 isoform X1 n=1 Tax=Haliotis rubra TaxID=36100 RepID=UPI001EE6320D|nr:gelsolin-like protein 2 isoform X1 [Haliotis rubra]XP_046562172.1 gelsolin-like protein 2 isoform X1 [Haliotis rubra]